jgi:predicted phage terminase large subunit-like protein
MKKREITQKAFQEEVNRILEQQKALVKPFPDDSDEAKEARREKGRKDIFWFAGTYLPHYFTCDFAPFHEELHEMSTTGHQTLNAAAVPRKHGKSSFVTLLEPIHQALYEISPFTLIIAGSEELAEPFITFIKLEFEENERLKQDFGDCITPGHWTSREIWIKNRACIMGVGIGSNFRGLRFRQRRPSLIVGDDIDADEHVGNIKYCKKVCEKLIRAGFPSLEKSGTMIVVGTLINKKSAFSQYIDHCREKSKELLDRFGKSNIKVIVYAAIQDGKPLWEAAYTLEELERIKIQLGPNGWASEMMNDPLDDSKFREEWFQYITQEFILLRKRYWTYYSGSDPSAKDTEKHDYKAHVCIAQDRETKKIYVAEAWGRKAPIGEFYQAFFDMYTCYHMLVCVFEENGYQIYLSNDMVKYCREKRQYPNIKNVTHTSDKLLRIGRLEAPVWRGDILFQKHHSDQDTLVEQLHYLGTNMNDDLPDALEMAVWGLENGGPSGKCVSRSSGRRSFREIVNGLIRPSAILRREYYRN